jgi:hypothetical protein
MPYNQRKTGVLKKKAHQIYRHNVDEELVEIKCNLCNKWLPVDCYYADKHRSSGYQSRCKQCQMNVNSKKTRFAKYGITEEEYNRKLEEQDGLCFACQKNNANCIDHCHDTGQIRYILCNGCNTALGYMKEDPVAIKRLMNIAIACQVWKGNKDFLDYI